MIGTKCRLHDLGGDDLGIAHLPSPIQVADLVATEHQEFRVVDVIVSPPGSPIGALVKSGRCIFGSSQRANSRP